MDRYEEIIYVNELRKQAIFNSFKKAEKNELKGGKADNLTLEGIAKKHNISINELNKQLELGLKIESEHTDNKEKAKEIVLDHLEENCCYYTDNKPKNWAEKEIKDDK